MKPGLTGLWQLSGDHLIHENVEYDLCNFFMDLAILLHTSIFAMRGVLVDLRQPTRRMRH